MLHLLHISIHLIHLLHLILLPLLVDPDPLQQPGRHRHWQLSGRGVLQDIPGQGEHGPICPGGGEDSQAPLVQGHVLLPPLAAPPTVRAAALTSLGHKSPKLPQELHQGGGHWAPRLLPPPKQLRGLPTKAIHFVPARCLLLTILIPLLHLISRSLAPRLWGGGPSPTPSHPGNSA